tara:strand:- start:5883 stop:6146 length:264 start_codon:yes stop_codon:yes gene_type:complete
MKVGDLVKSNIMYFHHGGDPIVLKRHDDSMYGTVLEVEDEEKFEKEFRHHKRGGRIFLDVKVLWNTGKITVVQKNTLQKVQSACKKW